jgi:hypothetical protein
MFLASARRSRGQLGLSTLLPLYSLSHRGAPDLEERSEETNQGDRGFFTPDVSGKVMYLVPSEMNERYKRRLLRNWGRINKKLPSIRMVKYGNKAMVDAFCLTQNS